MGATGTGQSFAFRGGRGTSPRGERGGESYGGPGDGVVNGKNMDAHYIYLLGHHGSSFKRLAPFSILLVKTQKRELHGSS